MGNDRPADLQRPVTPPPVEANMRSPPGGRTTCFLVLLAAAAAGCATTHADGSIAAGAANGSQGPRDDWPRVYVADPGRARIVRRALAEASHLFDDPSCQALLEEFSDPQGRPLSSRLAAMNMDLQTYLRLIVFTDVVNRHPGCVRRDN